MEDKSLQPEIAIDPDEPSSLTLIMTLGVAGFFSGLILVVSYFYTLPVIERNKEQSLQEAIYRVLPGCQKYEALILNSNNELVKPGTVSGGENKSSKRIFLGYNDKGSILGFAIPASEPGFADLITLLYGYEAQGKVIIGFEVLENKETPGLGDKIIKDKNFLANFRALSVEPLIEPAKPGKKNKPNQVETITGATISSKAVIRALQNSMTEWRQAIDGYVQKNQLTYNQNP